MDKCTCREVRINGKPTGQKNINPNCTQHGVGTDYWNAKYSERPQ